MKAKKIVVTSKYIDQNGHVGEAGYLSIAIDALWEFNKEIGTSQKFLQLSCAPVTFSSKIDYLKEVFEHEEIEFRIERLTPPEDKRKWRRKIQLFKSSGELAVKILANGAWFDLNSRKITTPPNEITEIFDKNFYGLETK